MRLPIPAGMKEVITISIHVSDRTLSRLQYEDSFRRIRDDLHRRMERTPKRRMDTVAKPLLDAFNDAFEMVLCIEEDPVRGTATAAQKRYDRIVRTQYLIKQIEKPLWTYWNICDDGNEREMKSWSLSSRANFCADLNGVLKILHDMQLASSKYDPEKDVGLTMMRYYTEAEIENAAFLTAIRDLHRMTHGKVLRLPAMARDAEAGLLLRFIDTAWYCAAYGNKMRLDDDHEREIRRKVFSNALSALNKAQRPLFNIFSIGSYSNEEMKDWVQLFNDSVRLLAAVQKSDRQRTG